MAAPPVEKRSAVARMAACARVKPAVIAGHSMRRDHVGSAAGRVRKKVRHLFRTGTPTGPAIPLAACCGASSSASPSPLLALPASGPAAGFRHPAHAPPRPGPGLAAGDHRRRGVPRRPLDRRRARRAVRGSLDRPEAGRHGRHVPRPEGRRCARLQRAARAARGEGQPDREAPPEPRNRRTTPTPTAARIGQVAAGHPGAEQPALEEHHVEGRRGLQEHRLRRRWSACWPGRTRSASRRRRWRPAAPARTPGGPPGPAGRGRARRPRSGSWRPARRSGRRP